MPSKRKINFRNKDEWLVTLIDGIVSTKKKLGFKTSFSYELVRLAKKGLIDSAEGAAIDRKVIDDIAKG
jgi:hypothetical protein